jgi:hypothetical protein
VATTHARRRPTADESLAALDGQFILLSGVPYRVNILAIYEQGNRWLILFAIDGATSFMRMVCVPPCGPAQLLIKIAEHLTSDMSQKLAS